MDTIESLADQLGRLSITDCLALTRHLETAWGPFRAPPIPLPGLVPLSEPTPDPQTEFTLTLSHPGPNKLAVIKAVRELTQLGLKEAKELVEAAPKPVLEGLLILDAQAALDKLLAAGAQASLS